MKSKRLTILLPLLVGLTMLASLITPAPVLAAGEPPPPPGEKGSKTQPASNKPAPPASPAGASYAAEVPATDPSGAAIASPLANASLALSVEAIAQAGAVLIGPSGNPMPLAERDTVNVLLTVGDVFFKGSGGTECTAGWCDYDTIANALANFSTRNGSGTIYARGELIEPGAVDVNGTTLSLGKLTGLAWDGEDNYSPRLTGGLLTIQNMLKGFTVDGFYISKGIYAHDNAGTLRLQNLSVTSQGDDGIYVTNHNGSIDIFNVTDIGGSFSGAYLDNTRGTGNVTISNSAFNYNNNGLTVITNGSVLLDRVEAIENLDKGGALLMVKKGATVKDSRFNDTMGAGIGLDITGLGALSLQNVEARQNGGGGIALSVTGDITLNGGLLTGNSKDGLLASSSGGNIILNNLQSLDNVNGVWADNSASVSAKTVTISNSLFNHSTHGNGLTVYSKGSITLNHIRAENNNGNGVLLDNALYDDTSHSYKGSGSINILNSAGNNQFSSNHGAAVFVNSKGAIKVKGVSSRSDQYGLWLDGCAMDQDPAHLTHYCLGKGNISVTATKVEATLVGDSLDAGTGGAITLDGGTFHGNEGGVGLNNSLTTSAKAVTVNNSEFTVGVLPTAVPLNVISKGNITLNNVWAHDNATTTQVILLDNCIRNGGVTCTGSGSVSVLNSLGPTILMENHSASSSLSIFSHGAVTLTGVIDTFNNSGAHVENNFGTAAVTVSKSSFAYNETSGLYIKSNGNITLTSVNAAYNTGVGGFGALLINDGSAALASATVNISKSNFDVNRDYGLSVYAMGNLSLNNVSANFNLGATYPGAMLASRKGNVTLQDSLGPNQFNNNIGVAGLYITSGSLAPGTWGGNISISGVTARDNLNGYGIELINQYATPPKTVTAQKILAEENGMDGLNVKSKGSVTLNGVQANFNAGGYGVYIDTCGLPAPCEGSGNVSILSTLGPNSMSSNAYGLWISANGSVLVNGVTASDNTSGLSNVSGAGITNSYAVGKTVTVNQSSFNANHGGGLYVHSAGVITLNNIDASYNLTSSGTGTTLYNDSAFESPGVNILSTSGINQFYGNAGEGLFVETNGNIVLSKVIAGDNNLLSGASGADLYTSGASSVSITCSAFNYNTGVGLWVTMGSGTLSFKSVAANHNLGGQDFNLGIKKPVMSWTVCGY